MEIDILRNGSELKLRFYSLYKGYGFTMGSEISDSHMLLKNNISLINPAKLTSEELPAVMKNIADTDGLIVDLRQYPKPRIMHTLAEYLVDKWQPFAIMSLPYPFVPGLFLNALHAYSGGINESDNPDVYFYDKKVVILMNEQTMSRPEFTIMSLRNGPNVTVMGTNSIGADGDITQLPLPGGITMVYTGWGVYTPEGGQTQRIGLTPDIVVEQTIQGIKDGRDELMDEAIRFILEQAK